MFGNQTFRERREQRRLDREVRRIAAAKDPDPRPGQLEHLVKIGSVTVRFTVALRNDLGGALQQTLAGDEAWDVRKVIARHRNLHPDAARTLSADTDEDVLAALAANPKTPGDTLNVLADSADEDVRKTVAKHAAVPLATALTLSIDPSREVTFALATNLAMPAAVLTVLAGSADGGTLRAVAAHPATPAEVCHRLLVPAIRSGVTTSIARAAAGWPVDVVDAVTVLAATRKDLGDADLLAIALATVQPAA